MQLLWLFMATVATALTLRGSLKPEMLPLGASDFESTTVRLSGPQGTDSSPLTESGEFSFPVTPGNTYALELQSVSLLSDGVYRVDVEEGNIKVHKILSGHKFDDKGPEVDYNKQFFVDTIRPSYVIPREEFSVLGMVKSPMMLMSLFSLVMVFVVPKITANMDPETLKEIQDSQKQNNEAFDKVQNFDMAAYMAGRKNK